MKIPKSTLEINVNFDIVCIIYTYNVKIHIYSSNVDLDLSPHNLISKDKTMMMTMFKQMNDNTLMIMSKMQEEKNGFSRMMTNTVRKIIGFFTGGQKPQPASITPGKLK